MLLPLACLRRLVVPRKFLFCTYLQNILALMPRLLTVIYHGPEAGETYHRPLERQGSLWLRLVTMPSYEDDNQYNYQRIDMSHEYIYGDFYDEEKPPGSPGYSL